MLKLILLLFCLSASAQQFHLYDATGYTDKPDFTQYGIQPITVAYPQYIWDKPDWNDKTTMPNEAKLDSFVAKAKQNEILVLDIEHWPLRGDPATVAQSITQLQTVIKEARKPDPNIKIGLYGAIPQRDYWSPNQIASQPQKMMAWQRTNTNLSALAKQVDIIFPSVYTFYDDQKGWRTYAIAQIQEARRVAPGKPVYIFLWPQFHESNPCKGGQFVPADYWTMELQTAKQYADGAVIWCCTGHPKWDDNAPWWRATLAFLKSR